MIHTFCIPCIEQSYSSQYIFNILKQSKIGKIRSIREFPSHHHPSQKKVFVKCEVPNENENLKQRITNGQPINIMFQEPSFWKMIPCK